MLTFNISPEQLMCITWSLDDGIRTDLNDFIRSTVYPENFIPLSCSYYITGEKNVLFLEWRSLVMSITSLLNQGVPMKFICTSKRIYERMLEFGFFLLGEVILQLTPQDPSPNI